MQLQIQWFKNWKTRSLTYTIKEWRNLLAPVLETLPQDSYTISIEGYIATLTINGNRNDLLYARQMLEPIIRGVVRHKYRIQTIA